MLNLIMHGKHPSGMLRLDHKPCESTCVVFEVSILIDPDVQGQGLASAALGLVRLLVSEATFEARVHPENTASINLFLGAGYVPQGDRLVNRPRHS